MTARDEGATTSGAKPSPAARAARNGSELTTLNRARRELAALDLAVYDAVAGTPSPTIDRALARITNAADHSRLWLATAALLSVAGTKRRRAALIGVAAVAATSAVGNLAVKPVLSRRRPERTEYRAGRRGCGCRSPTPSPPGTPRPRSPSPRRSAARFPPWRHRRLMATTVAYSRVHTGVHYPGDVVIGALIGSGIGTAARLVARRAGLSAR